jgi:hypothetical protein
MPAILTIALVAACGCGGASGTAAAEDDAGEEGGVPVDAASPAAEAGPSDAAPADGASFRTDAGEGGHSAGADGGDAGSPVAAGDAGGAGAHIITFQDFDTSLSLPGWSIGAQAGGMVGISTDITQNFMGSPGSVLGSYPAPTGGVYVWGAYDLSALALEDVYVEFWARMPAALHGLKFLKVFGGNAGGDTGNYANTTFGLDYTGVDFGCMYQVSFGDGTSASNDTDNVINFDGTNPEWIGRSYGHGAVVQTPQMSLWASSNWGTSWHHFRLRAKFNSGTTATNEVADGAYYVEIDGKVYVDASGLFNRNPSNAPIDRIEIFGWSQNGTAPFQIEYDNLTISTGGFAP